MAAKMERGRRENTVLDPSQLPRPRTGQEKMVRMYIPKKPKI